MSFLQFFQFLRLVVLRRYFRSDFPRGNRKLTACCHWKREKQQALEESLKVPGNRNNWKAGHRDAEIPPFALTDGRCVSQWWDASWGEEVGRSDTKRQALLHRKNPYSASIKCRRSRKEIFLRQSLYRLVVWEKNNLTLKNFWEVFFFIYRS